MIFGKKKSANERVFECVYPFRACDAILILGVFSLIFLACSIGYCGFGGEIMFFENFISLLVVVAVHALSYGFWLHRLLMPIVT